jgi:tRNA threonylcarbamoyladenosine biosynthesis protein TsaB
MKLKIDTTRREEIVVEIKNIKTGKIRLSEKQKTGSQALLPLIVKALKRKRIKLTDIDEIEVNPGPGSFTGTRVGVTVANVLGFLLKVPVNGKKNNIVIPKYEKSKFD